MILKKKKQKKNSFGSKLTFKTTKTVCKFAVRRLKTVPFFSVSVTTVWDDPQSAFFPSTEEIKKLKIKLKLLSRNGTVDTNTLTTL